MLIRTKLAFKDAFIPTANLTASLPTHAPFVLQFTIATACIHVLQPFHTDSACTVEVRQQSPLNAL